MAFSTQLIIAFGLFFVALVIIGTIIRLSPKIKSGDVVSGEQRDKRS